MLKMRVLDPSDNSKKYRGDTKNKHFKKTVILLEHEGQVKNCLKRFKEIKGQKLIIALSPFAMYELGKQNIPYKTPEDYYDPQELYKLGIDNHQKVEDLCDIVDERIQNACPAVAKLGIRPALFSFFLLKIIYDVTTTRLFQLSRLIDAENPDALYIYDSKRYPFGTSEMAPYIFLDNRESIYARLLACDGWGVPVAVLPYVPHPEDSDVFKKTNSSKTLERKMLWWLQRHPKLLDLAAETRKRGWRGLFGGLKSYLRADKDIEVLLFGPGYNWDDCREQLRSVGIDPVFTRIHDDLEYWMSDQFSDKVDANALLNAWKGLRTYDKFRKFFIWGNVDFFPIVEDRLQFLVERLTPACLKAYEETAKIVKKGNIKAFLTSTFARCTYHSAAQAARNYGIPVVIWQHGSYGYMDYSMAIYNDIMSSDVHFVFGDGVVNKYAKAARRFGTRLVAIGSSSLESLYRTPRSNKAKQTVRLTPGKKVVLYITTHFSQNHLYLSIPPPFSDNHFWCTQRTILDVLAKHDDYTIVVKTFPNPTYRDPPLRSYARENNFVNCQFIMSECTFTDLLSITDLLVIDFPTTTLLEALTTSKTIFVYTGHLYIDAKARKLLERRAFCYQELKSFTDALNKYLSEGKIDRKINLNDKKFLEAYGVGPHGIGSAIRAAKTLKQIISHA